jgi:hypothetical protein
MAVETAEMLENDNSGLNDDLNSAAQCANTDWDGMPHSAKSDLAEATILSPQKRNRRWDPREKARITAESFEPRANISAVARDLLGEHAWRRLWSGPGSGGKPACPHDFDTGLNSGSGTKFRTMTSLPAQLAGDGAGLTGYRMQP